MDFITGIHSTDYRRQSDNTSSEVSLPIRRIDDREKAHYGALRSLSSTAPK